MAALDDDSRKVEHVTSGPLAQESPAAGLGLNTSKSRANMGFCHNFFARLRPTRTSVPTLGPHNTSPGKIRFQRKGSEPLEESENDLVRRMLQDDSGDEKSFQYFLKREYAEELAALWIQSEQLLASQDELTGAQFVEQSISMYDNFLGPASPHHIGLALDLCCQLDQILLFSNGLNSNDETRDDIDISTAKRLVIGVRQGTAELLQPYIARYMQHQERRMSDWSFLDSEISSCPEDNGQTQSTGELRTERPSTAKRVHGVQNKISLTKSDSSFVNSATVWPPSHSPPVPRACHCRASMGTGGGFNDVGGLHTHALKSSPGFLAFMADIGRRRSSSSEARQRSSFELLPSTPESTTRPPPFVRKTNSAM